MDVRREIGLIHTKPSSGKLVWSLNKTRKVYLLYYFHMILFNINEIDLQMVVALLQKQTNFLLFLSFPHSLTTRIPSSRELSAMHNHKHVRYYLE